MPIILHTADVKFTLKQKSKLKAFIRSQIFKFSNSQIVELSFVFCSDEYLLAINQKFLNHDYYTDIITFPLSENEQSLEGEIYISIERVRENAKKYMGGGSPFRGLGGWEDELHRVMFHGVLHLLGYKDKTKAQKAEMRKTEDRWLEKFKSEKAKINTNKWLSAICA